MPDIITGIARTEEYCYRGMIDRGKAQARIIYNVCRAHQFSPPQAVLGGKK
jgi:hypothetical protein